jgi:muramoyltetrapeptide carboxypeptidase LdcA involved in peptidoglycan recycling
MKKLPKLQRGDKVAIVSPSFAAPGVWPEVYALGLKRLREVFELEPVACSFTKKVGASGEERSSDLVAAFADDEIKAVIASLGGDDQVTYIKNLPVGPFVENPKPFFGFSDNSHFCNFLFLHDVPSFYGASLFTQFTMQPEMDDLTVQYLKHALFDEGEFELFPSTEFCDSNIAEDGETLIDWDKSDTLPLRRLRESNTGWVWDGVQNASGLLWGGCIESIDEMLRHAVRIPSAEQFKNIVLMLESSEEMPTAEHVRRVVRAFGERGVLGVIQGVVVGRPKAWHFNHQYSLEKKREFRLEQQEVILKTVRQYNTEIPVVQNIDFGHTDPQIPMPYGNQIRIDCKNKKLFATF